MAERELTRRIYKAVGERIATTRRAVGRVLTQAELARRAGEGLSRSVVANIERGRQRISVHHLYLIARALGAEPGSLLPPANEVLESAGEAPSDPQLKAWLEKISRKPGHGR
jgi:transcriptional regulator with XRE-family HTH domain